MKQFNWLSWLDPSVGLPIYFRLSFRRKEVKVKKKRGSKENEDEPQAKKSKRKSKHKRKEKHKHKKRRKGKTCFYVLSFLSEVYMCHRPLSYWLFMFSEMPSGQNPYRQIPTGPALWFRAFFTKFCGKQKQESIPLPVRTRSWNLACWCVFAEHSYYISVL